MSTPKLRFKDFNGNKFGKWEEIILGKVSDIRDGTHDSPTYIKEGYPLITSKNLKNGRLDFSDINYISKDDFESINKRSKVDIGDIIFGMIGTIGNPVLLEHEGFAIKNVALIKQKNDLINSFLIHYLQSNFFKNQVRLLNVGNTQKFLALGQIRSIKVIKPSLEEQTKIASFLSEVDKKISQLTQKQQLLSQYKQGMMQKLFSQQIRFKADDGSEFEEWNDIQLKDISHRITRKNKELNQNALTISAQLGLINQQEYFSKQIASRDLSKYYLLHKGEYAYNKSYSAGYPMGAIKRLKLYDKGVVSTLYICFSLNEYINSDYFEQFVESGLLVPELEKIAQEGARNHGLLNISLQEFFEVDLKIPSLDEQAKIANFLSAIDQKIEIAAHQIEQAKQWKKGLLQQMFV